jgi:hypothetical protein
MQYPLNKQLFELICGFLNEVSECEQNTYEVIVKSPTIKTYQVQAQDADSAKDSYFCYGSLTDEYEDADEVIFTNVIESPKNDVIINFAQNMCNFFEKQSVSSKEAEVV